MKASSVPSGDQVAKRSTAGVEVNCLVMPVAKFLTQMSMLPGNAPFEKGAFPGNIDICVKNFATGITKQLTSTPAVDRFATWSPDGTELAFMSNRSGKNQ